MSILDASTLGAAAPICYTNGRGRAARKTSPQEARLTIDDLLLLDREWAKSDRFHSTELIGGRIYHTPARYTPRAGAVTRLLLTLRDALADIPNAPTIINRASIAMSPHDLPLPDLVLTSQPDGPGFVPCDSFRLVIEVAESAVSFFTGVKLRMYARHGIPEYWVVDLKGRKIDQFWSAAEGQFAEDRVVVLGERIEAATIAGLSAETGGLA